LEAVFRSSFVVEGEGEAVVGAVVRTVAGTRVGEGSAGNAAELGAAAEWGAALHLPACWQYPH